MNSVFFDPTLTDDERRDLLYSGQLFVYTATPGAQKLVAFAREMIEDAFGGRDPELAQHDMPVEQYAALLSDLKPRFIHHPSSKECIQQILTETGCDPEQTYFDVPRMRTSTSENYLTSGIAYAFHPHRDTWYSAPMCQINWWLPIYPILPSNAMAFHPAYWNRPVKNGSRAYNYEEWNRTSRLEAAKHVKTDTRVQPKPEEPMTAAARLVPPEMQRDGVSSPILSVVICTWNRSRLLRLTLEQMTRLEVPPGTDWELLVVNNNCSDDTDAVLADFKDRLPLVRLSESRPGKSFAANLAVEKARGDYIIWTDDDVLVAPDWLKAYLRAFANWPDATIFAGAIEPWFEESPPQWLAEIFPKVANAYAALDHGPTGFALTSETYPYGANMERAVNEGVRLFNFGRCSRGAGTHKFKMQWGGREEDLWWYGLSSTSGVTTPSPKDGRFRWGPRIWQKLPTSVATKVGPSIVRYIP